MEARTKPILHGQLALALPTAFEKTSSDAVDRGRATYELDIDAATFTLRAYETFTSIGRDFRAGVVADLKTQGVVRPRLQSLRVAKPLVAIEVLPKVPKSSLDNHVLVYAAYVGDPEGTVQVLAFYLTSNRLAEAPAWIVLARKIAQSATRGPKRLVGEPVTIGSRERTPPASWVAIAETVMHIKVRLVEVVPLGAPSGARCELEIGTLAAHPSPGKRAAASIRGKLGHFDVTWTDWSDDEGPIIAVTESAYWNRSTRVSIRTHAWCRARDASRLAELRAMVERFEALPTRRP